MLKSGLLLFTCLFVVITRVEQVLASTNVQIAHSLNIPSVWQQLPLSDNLSERVVLTFALKNRNVEWLQRIFENVNNPMHRDYEKYLTMKQVSDITSPQQTNLVIEYLNSIPDCSILNISKHGNLITVKISLQSVNLHLNAKMKPFVHKETKEIIFRSLNGFSLPLEISKIVKTVFGIHHFPHGNAKKKFTAAQSSHPITPKEIWNRYNVSLPTSINGQSSQAIASLLGQFYNSNDLSQFQHMYNLTQMQPIVNGDNNNGKPGMEASLDIQYIMGIAQGINTTINSIASNNIEDPFVQWISVIQSQGDSSAWIHSISYGAVEKDIPADVKETVDQEFQKIGSTGRTIFVSSGDNGVRCSDYGDRFEPEWPTSSPFVVSVGATEFKIKGGKISEIGADFTGGGFSDAYKRPSYQDEAVTNYLNQESFPDRSYFNQNGRMFPDMTLIGKGFQVILSGKVQSVDGTSASTPSVAALFSLLNNIRFLQNKKPIGFLNPWLYQIAPKTPNAFYDITEGYNSFDPCPGFFATKSFDPVSGIGVPNFAILKDLILTK
ncbi:predicted protein [Naegleria gruberi]|uniref:Predicted protein n=1 Tax=Naegleria gruberi TaxID=5762 RepID=D2VT43_NAEGR|nr:uncharacterized protein NAEGRDRAFT_72167 [Naegleria gruberi]EFC40019.1 predicted protein [Naegleria gruberi]|eukprot:XP_002672763.1 predicted protein [Naegleria gruberi strain NEG-M]